MATSKKPAAKTAAAPAKTAPKSTPAPAAEKEKKVPLSKMRGPRGVAETAKITVLAPTNPKRPSSKAFQVFSLYKTGMTVGAFCDKVDATDNKGAATPNLVYDANHGFISIEGYTPPNPVEPKAPKEKKAPAEPKGKPVAKAKTAPKKDKEAKEEVVD